MSKESIYYDWNDLPMLLSDGLRCTMDDDGRFGYVDDEDNWVIEPVFHTRVSFKNGVAIVSGGTCSRGNIINTKGEKLMNQDYAAHSQEFSNGLALFSDGWQWPDFHDYFFVNEQGVNPFGRVFEDARPFIWGFAAVKDNGKWYVMDTKGKLLKQIRNYWWLNDSYSTTYGYRPGKYRGKCGMKNLMGEWMIKPIFDEIYLNWAGASISAKLNGKWGLLDMNGDILVDFKFDELWGPEYGIIKVKKVDKFGLLHMNGTILVPPVYDECSWLKGRYLYARNGNMWDSFTEEGYPIDLPLWGIIDTHGNWVVEPKYSEIKSMDNGLFRIRQAEHWGLMKADGTVLIEPTKFTTIRSFKDGRAYAETYPMADNQSCHGTIDIEGNFYENEDEGDGPEYEDDIASEFYPFRENGYLGFKDQDGSVVTSPRYEEVGKFVNGLAPAAIIKN